MLQDVGELKTIHNQKIERALHWGLSLQPYVVIVDSTEVFCVINNTYFKLETPIKAVDLCFKSFFTLNVQYPTESEQVWLFIQHYFYEIKLKSDKNILSVKTFINDLIHL